MTGLNPVGMIGITKMGGFDFPIQVCANNCKPNVDPLGMHPHTEAWYGQCGSPKRQQGWPIIMEQTAEVEDPNVAPWIDLIIDIDRPAVIYHTGRLSGTMAIELADNTHFSKVIVHAVPYKSGAPIQLHNATQSLTPGPNQPNTWFWLVNNANANELLQTIKIDIASPAAKGFQSGEIYKLLVEWEFWHKVNGTSHHEPFCGFDDSITFKISAATIV